MTAPVYPSRAAYARAVRREITASGRTPQRAVYDAAGNCTTCGESGRCPGWHPASRDVLPFPRFFGPGRPAAWETPVNLTAAAYRTTLQVAGALWAAETFTPAGLVLQADPCAAIARRLFPALCVAPDDLQRRALP